MSDSKTLLAQIQQLVTLLKHKRQETSEVLGQYQTAKQTLQSVLDHQQEALMALHQSHQEKSHELKVILSEIRRSHQQEKQALRKQVKCQIF